MEIALTNETPGSTTNERGKSKGTWKSRRVMFSFFKDFIYLFIYFQRGEGLEREGEKLWLPPGHPLLGTWPTTQACALHWESNPQPFGLQASAQSTKPRQLGLMFSLMLVVITSSYTNRYCLSLPLWFLQFIVGNRYTLTLILYCY